MALSGTVKVPGMGDVPKKYLAVAGAAVVGIVGYGFYRKRQAATAIPITADQTSAGDAFTDTTPAGPSGSNGVTNQFGDQVPPQIIQSPNPGILTNEDWLTEAQSLDIGASDTVVTAALVKALGGTPTTQTEQEIFHQVVAIIGPPPQGNQPLKLTSTPAPTPQPTTGSKPKYEMVWGPVTVTGSYVGITLASLQNIYTQQAAGLGAAKVNAAVRASYISQAAQRNGLSANAKLKAGQIIQIRKAERVS